MSLKEVFENFKQSKASLRRIHDDTIRCFDEIEQKLADPHGAEIADDLRTSFFQTRKQPLSTATMHAFTRELADIRLNLAENLTEELYTTEERNKVSSLLAQDPALIVVGQTNSGKSSIINELLGVKALPTSERPSTARIVRIKYAAEPFCRLVDKHGAVLEEIDLKGKNRIPRKKIELKQSDREDPSKVNATVVTGLNNEFLRAGVDIIDSPGGGENDALDDVVKAQLAENPLAFMIYVIDGRNLFTVQDRDVLSEITTENQVLDIFFVVSKLEPEISEVSDDDEAGLTPDDESVQHNKKRRVYERLVSNGFLPVAPNTSLGKHERFHGLSAWKIHEYNERKRKNPAWDDPDGSFTEYIEAFCRFQRSVQTFAEDCLRARVEQVCKVIIRVLARCLDFFIQKANILRQGKELIVETLQKVLRDEAKLHDDIMRSWDRRSQDIKLLLSNALQRAHDGVIKEAVIFEYASTEFNIPRDGYVSSKEAVSQCQDQLQRMVINKLQREIKEVLSMLFVFRDQAVAQMKEKLEAIEQETATDEGVSTAIRALTSSLLSSYEVQISLSANSGGFIRVLKNIGNWFVKFVKAPIKTLRGEIPVGTPSWKKSVVSQVLERADPSQISDEIARNLQSHFSSCHRAFIAEVTKIQGLFERGNTIKGEQMKKILDCSPKLALLEMKAYSVMDRFRFGDPQMGRLIGKGGQGSVYDCANIRTASGNPCVVKVINISEDHAPQDLALELHHTRSLDHPNIMPVLCSIIQPGTPPQQITTVLMVSERMKCDLQQELPRLRSLRKRLTIALDVAKALQYLHREGVMHRDVKGANVLLDVNDVAKLTDLGLCKPEGLAMGSLVGTPVFMAPEMIKKKYNKSVDVYAFGIMLWMVCEGTGDVPKNINYHPIPLLMLAKNAVEKRTPERLPVFPESCWRLMEKCWSQDPEERPSFDSVARDLVRILRDRNIK